MRRAQTASVAALLVAAGVTASAGVARADDVDAAGTKLLGYESEVNQIGRAIRAPRALTPRKTDVPERRLVSAQVAFGIGNYDDAAIMLFDLVEQGPGNRAYDESLYYLAESLYQRGDYLGARNYFLRIVDDRGPSATYYQAALERLIEMSLKLRDDTDVQRFLAALKGIPAAKRRDSMPYVHARYLHFSGDYSGALAVLKNIPPSSEYYIKGLYFAAASYVALEDLANASEAFLQLTRQPPKTEDDYKVIELAHMAIGRLYYERDQSSQAIDHYLRVSRKSKLFDEALYEVAWVYVKDRQFDKALRALELLALANPDSAMAPDVRILEGNLRVRKARTIEDTGKGNALEEYKRAMDVFNETSQTYGSARTEIERIIAEREDPRKFVHQITGRESETFDVAAQLPPVAVQMLRQEPEVARVVAVDTDLVAIRADLRSTEETINRLRAAVSSPSRVNIFPPLAKKRERLTEIFEDVQQLRTRLTEREWELVSKYAAAAERAEFQDLVRRRIELDRKLQAMPDSSLRYSDRVTQARRSYADLEKRAQEVAVHIDGTEATVVAVEKYLADARAKSASDQLADKEQILVEVRGELAALRADLRDAERDVVLAKDQAGVGDAASARSGAVRDEFRDALNAEHEFLLRIGKRLQGGERTKAEQIANLISKGSAVLDRIDATNGEMDQIVDKGLAEVRTAIAEEEGKLLANQQQLEAYETGAQTLGGEVLTANFGKVSEKFYQVLVRADVGIIDVAWAAKEQAETMTRRLTLEESRERRVLREQFGDVAKSPPTGANRLQGVPK
jgi:tetratricopeptide (TPR) repeat protein